jgi:hypothetical protein
LGGCFCLLSEPKSLAASDLNHPGRLQRLSGVRVGGQAFPLCLGADFLQIVLERRRLFHQLRYYSFSKVCRWLMHSEPFAEYVEEQRRLLERHRAAFVAGVLGWWIVPALAVYAFGWAFAWVRRGFREPQSVG